MSAVRQPLPPPSGLRPDRYEAVLAAAMADFAEHGYGPASMARIAGHAGVSKALLFHHFGTKAGLFSHVYRYGVALWEDMLEAARPQPGDDLFGAAVRMTVVKCDLARRHPELSSFLMRAWQEEGSDARPIVRETAGGGLLPDRAEWLQLAEDTELSSGVTPDQAVDLLTWTAEGFARDGLGDVNAPDVEARMLAFVAILRHGLTEEAQE